MNDDKLVLRPKKAKGEDGYKTFSIRIDSQTYAKIVERCTKMNYKSLTSYAVDMLTGVGNGAKKYTPFNPDIERLFCDVEDSLKYALRLEKRLAKIATESELEDLRAEITHFKIFVAKKSEALLERVRDEHFNQKRT